MEWMDQVRQATVDMDLEGMVYVSDLMPPRQAHFFVSFESVEDAEVAAEKITSLNESLVAPAYFAQRRSELGHGKNDDGGIAGEESDFVRQDDDDHEDGRVQEENTSSSKKKDKKKERMPRVVCRYAEIENVAEKIKNEIVMAEISASACGIPGLILLNDFITERSNH